MFDPNRTSVSYFRRRTLWRILMVACVLGAICSALLIVHATQSEDYWNQRAAASYTGWVTTQGQYALSIEPCRHSPCDNVAIDITMVNTIGTRLPPCTLGGVLIDDGKGFDVYNICPSNIPIRATFTGDSLINGSTTAGSGTLHLQIADTYATYHLVSATIQEQNAVFGGH